MIAAAVMLAAALLSAATLRSDVTAQDADWRSDYESARSEARAKKMPLFVVFRCQR
jgi:hypothetical protein